MTTWYRLLAAGYLLLLTFALLSPSPLAWWGEAGVELEESVDLTLSGFSQHFAAYALLAGLFVVALRQRSRRGVAVCVMAACVHGLAAEGLQTFVPLRFCDWPDALANTLGAGSVWLVFGVIDVASRRRIRRASTA